MWTDSRIENRSTASVTLCTAVLGYDTLLCLCIFVIKESLADSDIYEIPGEYLTFTSFPVSIEIKTQSAFIKCFDPSCM